MSSKFICNKTDTVVKTKAGKIRGFWHDGVYKFYGIKYADAKRFQRPTEVKPWEGVKDALGYGFVCPMLSQSTPGTGEIRCPHRYWPMDENCQYLNVWTTKLGGDHRKPVMVWLHGGGFAAGSSIEQAAYDGTSLAAFGDVVVVTLNHRINILGYLDMSPYGEKYENSANAGTEDIVFALKWIQDNIAGFGGDPENVTIFGQSGGGEKVRMLMQCPEADGLFHKGIIQSGIVDGIGRDPSKAGLGLAYLYPMDSRPIIEALMAELGLTEAGDLETVPYGRLADAYNKVSPAVKAAGHYIGNGPMTNDFYVGDALEYGFTEHAKTIPVIVGSVINEFKGFHPTSNEAIEADGRGVIQGLFGVYTDDMIRLFEEAFPGKSLRDLADMDDVFRGPSIRFLARRAAECSAPSWSYMLTMDFDIDGGNGAWHCSEIPFVFHNAAITPFACQEGGAKLEDQMSRAWVNFAHSGDPNHANLPTWPPVTVGDEPCMLFDRESDVRHNHDHALLEMYAKSVHAGAGARPDLTKIKIEH